MIPEVFAGSEVLLGYAPHSPGQPSSARLFAPDAFTNPEHLKFALKGGLAASLCYIIYTSLALPEISTALTTIGVSRQKQVLRFTGALTGGTIVMLARQPQLRVLFISCVALLKYRFQLPGFELPEPSRSAQQQFGDCLARTLDGMADRLQGKGGEGMQNLEAAFELLRDSLQNSGAAGVRGALTANMSSFLLLSERITGLAVSLAKEIRN